MPYGGYSSSSNLPPYGDWQPPQPPFHQGGGYQPPFSQTGGNYQPPFQQGYQQQIPYQQSPYQQSPYPQSSPISLDYRNLIAGIGAIVAIVAFFLPAYTISFLFLGGRYWLDFFIALVALAIVILLQFGEQWFKSSTNPTIQRVIKSVTSEPRTWYIRLITVGSFGIFFHFILDLGYLNIWGVGSWLYLLGMVAIVVAGVLFIRPPASTTVPPIR